MPDAIARWEDIDFDLSGVRPVDAGDPEDTLLVEIGPEPAYGQCSVAAGEAFETYQIGCHPEQIEITET